MFCMQASIFRKCRIAILNKSQENCFPFSRALDAFYHFIKKSLSILQKPLKFLIQPATKILARKRELLSKNKSNQDPNRSKGICFHIERFKTIRYHVKRLRLPLQSQLMSTILDGTNLIYQLNKLLTAYITQLCLRKLYIDNYIPKQTYANGKAKFGQMGFYGTPTL